jgi:hypothetical protein
MASNGANIEFLRSWKVSRGQIEGIITGKSRKTLKDSQPMSQYLIPGTLFYPPYKFSDVFHYITVLIAATEWLSLMLNIKIPQVQF